MNNIINNSYANITIYHRQREFDKPAFHANVVIPTEAIMKPVIDADVIDNVQGIIKQNTGFEVKLEVVEVEKEEKKKRG